MCETFHKSFCVDFEESNYNNYLSSSEMPLPSIFLMMSLCFAVVGLYWILLLAQKKRKALKIHYFTSILAFVTSISLLLHAFNFNYIEKNGQSHELWKYFYYISLLAKNQLFYVTLAIMYKKFKFVLNTFKIVIALQFLATVASIALQETEQGSPYSSKLRDFFVLADILSCVMIIISALSFGEKLTTGNGDSVYEKELKLYQRFYFVFIFYTFLTRIFV